MKRLFPLVLLSLCFLFGLADPCINAESLHKRDLCYTEYALQLVNSHQELAIDTCKFDVSVIEGQNACLRLLAKKIASINIDRAIEICAEDVNRYLSEDDVHECLYYIQRSADNDPMALFKLYYALSPVKTSLALLCLIFSPFFLYRLYYLVKKKKKEFVQYYTQPFAHQQQHYGRNNYY